MKNNELLKKFIGENYEKIVTKKFNIPGFFFTSIYMYYRKMYLYGIIVFIVSLLLMFLRIPYLLIIINILSGLFVNKLYINYATNKINRIGKESLDNVKKEGGTSIESIYIGVLLEIIVIAILTNLLRVSYDKKETNVPVKTPIDLLDEYVEGEFNGILIFKSNINIIDQVTINVPDKFLSNSSDEQISYQYEVNNNKLNSCKFSLAIPDVYTSSDNLIRQMKQYYENDNSSSIQNETINGLIWNTFKKTDGKGTTYYYATTKNNQVYLLEYVIQTNADIDCDNFRSQIINSIKIK